MVWLEKYAQDIFFLKVGIKDYNVVINGRNFFDHSVKNDLRTCDNIRKITSDQGDDYIAGCLLDYLYIKKYYKMIEIDLNKHLMLIQ